MNFLVLQTSSESLTAAAAPVPQQKMLLVVSFVRISLFTFETPGAALTKKKIKSNP